MIQLETENNRYKNDIAIVVVGYNRLKSMKRLLTSLLKACYPNQNIPLIISVDCSGDQEIYDYVVDFTWPYGDKIVNIENARLGLLKHIYQCGDLTKYFKAIILLEDDLYVSPYFYRYTQLVVEKYGASNEIAQISLYKNEVNGYVGMPIAYYLDGNDVFLNQDVSTWGQCWTYSMWKEFTLWRDSHSEADVQRVDMPDRIKRWERAWSKYFNAYVVSTGRYVLYPMCSLTTNFSDAGEHGDKNNSIVQVNLLQNDFIYRFAPVNELTRYDIYGNNEKLYEWLGLSKEELRLDLYGFFKRSPNKRFILSTRALPYKKCKSFALNMRPMELNVKYNIFGKGITLYDTLENCKGSSRYMPDVTPYMLQGMNMKMVLKYSFDFICDKIVKKIK